jgi:hypothetical protein
LYNAQYIAVQPPASNHHPVTVQGTAAAGAGDPLMGFLVVVLPSASESTRTARLTAPRQVEIFGNCGRLRPPSSPCTATAFAAAAVGLRSPAPVRAQPRLSPSRAAPMASQLDASLSMAAASCLCDRSGWRQLCTVSATAEVYGPNYARASGLRVVVMVWHSGAVGEGSQRRRRSVRPALMLSRPPVDRRALVKGSC